MPEPHAVTYIVFVIFAGTAVLATLALFTRQSLLVAYIVLGAIFGPWGLKLVTDSFLIKQIGDIGIIFLLFLLGLEMQPQNLFHSLRKMSIITLLSCLIFFGLGFLVSYLFQYTLKESFIIGIATMFSSTIIGIKLLPTTILHHQHTGALLVSILLLQDVIAIAAIFITEMIADQSASSHLILIISAIPVLIGVAYLFERYILTPLLVRFDKIHEYIFILSIGWCLFMVELSHCFGLSDEIGAFIAGIALASTPISFYITESLKPLRDFFLVIFFFTIGASFNFEYFPDVFLPAMTLAALVLMLKPLVFDWLLYNAGEVKSVSREIGVRLGQLSEFSLLLLYVAFETNLLSPLTVYMGEAAIILTFIVSCYWTVLRYPTPLAISDSLRRD